MKNGGRLDSAMKMWGLVVLCAALVGGIAYANWDAWVRWPSLQAPLIGALKDPASAEFRNRSTPRGVLCGEVNGRNSMGGYVGFRRFISTETRFAIEGTPLTTWYGESERHGLVMARLKRNIESLQASGRELDDKANDAADFQTLWMEKCQASA